MIWNPEKMTLYEVLRPFSSSRPGRAVSQAGLSKIGRQGNLLILTYPDGTVKTIEPGQNIPL